MQAVYTDGASRYNFQSLMPTAFAMFGGTGLPGAYQSLAVAAGVCRLRHVLPLMATGIRDQSRLWGFRGGYTHNWNP